MGLWKNQKPKPFGSCLNIHRELLAAKTRNLKKGYLRGTQRSEIGNDVVAWFCKIDVRADTGADQIACL
jgi:hypothetical protein